MHGHALKWRYPFAALNCFGHLPENLVAAGPDQHRYVLADHLRRRVAVQQLGAPVPAHNDAVRRLPDNGFLGRLDDRGQETLRIVGRLALRDILLDGYEVGGCAVRVPNRRDGHLLDVKRAVLAPIDQLAVPDFALRDGSPEVLIESRVLSAGLEKARVLAHRFVLAVARHSGEGWFTYLMTALRAGVLITVAACPISAARPPFFRSAPFRAGEWEFAPSTRPILVCC